MAVASYVKNMIKEARRRRLRRLTKVRETNREGEKIELHRAAARREREKERERERERERGNIHVCTETS